MLRHSRPWSSNCQPDLPDFHRQRKLPNPRGSRELICLAQTQQCSTILSEPAEGKEPAQLAVVQLTAGNISIGATRRSMDHCSRVTHGLKRWRNSPQRNTLHHHNSCDINNGATRRSVNHYTRVTHGKKNVGESCRNATFAPAQLTGRNLLQCNSLLLATFVVTLAKLAAT
jgi:hypothetical protein